MFTYGAKHGVSKVTRRHTGSGRGGQIKLPCFRSKTLYKQTVGCEADAQVFMKIGRSVLLLTLLFLMVGCVRSTITNLTPSQLPRNQAGLYPVEMEWKSNQTALRYETIEPSVLIGTNIFPMQRTKLLTNRWEALVPCLLYTSDAADE